MTTYDFTHYPNSANNPVRTAQLAKASTIDLDDIKIEYCGGPIGGHGFRTGYWPVTYQGKAYSIFASVPHSMELPDQWRRVKIAAALSLAETLK